MRKLVDDMGVVHAGGVALTPRAPESVLAGSARLAEARWTLGVASSVERQLAEGTAAPMENAVRRTQLSRPRSRSAGRPTGTALKKWVPQIRNEGAAPPP